MTIAAGRDTSGHFHKEWDVTVSGALITRDDGSQSAVNLNFHRANLLPSWGPYVGDVISAFGWSPATRLAVLGATFGMFEELARAEHAMSSIVSLDDSRWIQTNATSGEEADVNAAISAIGANPFTGAALLEKDALTDGGARARVQILAEDLRTQGSWNRVKNALGGQINVVFTDDLLDRIADAEATSLSAAIHGYSGSVVVCHAVGPVNTSRENAKGITAWKSLLPVDAFYDWQTGQVM